MNSYKLPPIYLIGTTLAVLAIGTISLLHSCDYHRQQTQKAAERDSEGKLPGMVGDKK
jgi:hypothetical protein